MNDIFIPEKKKYKTLNIECDLVKLLDYGIISVFQKQYIRARSLFYFISDSIIKSNCGC